MPYDAKDVLALETETMETSLIDPAGVTGDYKWSGGVGVGKENLLCAL